MNLRSASGQFFLELNTEEALNVIAQLAQSIAIAKRCSFAQTIPIPVTFTEGWPSRGVGKSIGYPQVLNFRVDL